MLNALKIEAVSILLNAAGKVNKMVVLIQGSDEKKNSSVRF